MSMLSSLNDRGVSYKLFAGELSEIPLNARISINTINQYSFCVAEEDIIFREALKNSDILLPDGEGVVLAERMLGGEKLKKISGTDLHLHFLRRINNIGGRIFYLGSTIETLKKIKSKIRKQYPKIEVAYYSPPFGETFSDLENERIIKTINDFGPLVLFVGLTAPKQEKWAYKFRDNIKTNLVCTVGAVFDFYAETVKRPNNLYIKYKLEWLGRLLSNPKRMWKRYLYYGPIYILYMMKLKFAMSYQKVDNNMSHDTKIY